jgi:hypothetical protein
MALPSNIMEREMTKFKEDGSSNVVIRIYGASGTRTATTQTNRNAREFNKFKEDNSGDVTINAWIASS